MKSSDISILPPAQIRYDADKDKIFTVQNVAGRYKYWYNDGKEWQNDLELNVYDYGARQYDPAVGRWFTVDPKAEKFPQWSAYVYTYNNPIKFLDKDGMEGKPCCLPIAPTFYYVANKYEEVKFYLSLGYSYKEAIWNAYKNDLSSSIDLTPGLGDAKGFVEAFTGNDLISGKKLSGTERLLGLFLLSEFRGTKNVVFKVGGKSFKNIEDFYKSASKLSVRERIATYKSMAKEIANKNGWTYNKKLSKINKRDIYTSKKGIHYSLDTRHGAFEVYNKKGKHVGEVDFQGKLTKQKDKTGAHDLKL